MREGADIKGKLRGVVGANPEFLKEYSFPDGYVGVATRISNEAALERIIQDIEDIEFVEADSLISSDQGSGSRRRSPPTRPRRKTTRATATTTTATTSTTAYQPAECFVQQIAPLNLARISQRELDVAERNFSFKSDGSDTAIYVLDSGVRLSHQEFGGRAEYIPSGSDSINNPEVDILGHGTHVAGIAAGKVYGVSKGATVYSVKVLDDDGFGSVSDVVEGLNRVLRHHEGRGPGAKSVVNLSVGGEGYAPTLELAIRGLYLQGIPVVVAAGNNAIDACDSIPSHAFEAISVGCVDNNDVMCSFSNYGPCVDLFAPGKGIKAASADDNSGFVTKDGTSMSAPHVAGVIANLISSSHTPLSIDEIVDNILLNTTDNQITLPPEAAESPNRLVFAACEDIRTENYLPPGAADDSSSSHLVPHVVTGVISALLLLLVR